MTMDRTTAASRIDHLVVIRESSRHNRELMEGMILTTLSKVLDLPGARELVQAGLDVFDNPNEYSAVSKRVGRSTIRLIEREGVLYFYSMGSAAAKDLADGNAFARELVAVIRHYRPRTVWADSLTRLVRSTQAIGEILSALAENCDRVCAELDIRPNTADGQMFFTILGLMAANERDNIVRRHTAGRINQWRRGKWIPTAYPPGYRLEDGRLVLDDEMIEPVRHLLRLLADTSLTAAQVVQRAAELGVTTRMLKDLYGAKATIANARNPSGVLKTVMRWLEVYEKGRYEVLWPNPFPGVSEIAGIEVEELTDSFSDASFSDAREQDETDARWAHDPSRYKYGVLRLPYTVELPAGGWADQATFDGIRKRSQAFLPTGGSAHRLTAPLSGLFRFESGENEFALLAHRRATRYVLLKRPKDPNRRHQGWVRDFGSDGEMVAIVDRSELHSSLVTEIVNAIEHGLPAELNSSRFVSYGDLPEINQVDANIRALRQKIEATRENLRRARHFAYSAPLDEAEVWAKDCERFSSELRRLENDLQVLEEARAEPVLEDEFETNAQMVAAALAPLANTDRTGPLELRAALSTIIADERMSVSPTAVSWELSIELPHPEGVVRLGPIHGAVQNLLESTRRRNGTSPKAQRRERARRRAELVAAGLPEDAASVVAACPHPDLWQVIKAHLAEDPYPESVDRSWAAHVVSVYMNPDFHWEPGKWQITYPIRQRILDAIVSHGGKVLQSVLEKEGFRAEQVRYLRRQTKSPTGSPILATEGRGAQRTISLLPCPHCGGHASVSCLTPETQPGVLCPDCRRTPAANSPIFPEWYLPARRADAAA